MYLVVINLDVGLTVMRSSSVVMNILMRKNCTIDNLVYCQPQSAQYLGIVTGYMRNQHLIPSREKRFLPLQNIQTSCKALFDVYQQLFPRGQWHTL